MSNMRYFRQPQQPGRAPLPEVRSEVGRELEFLTHRFEPVPWSSAGPVRLRTTRGLPLQDHLAGSDQVKAGSQNCPTFRN